MLDPRERRKQSALLELGGFVLIVAIWAVALPTLIPWVNPPLLGFALVFASTAALLVYGRLVLASAIRPWIVYTSVTLGIASVAIAMIDASLRQNFRYGDCLRLEHEIVAAVPGQRADPSNAFQALRCLPSGGIIERWKGTPRAAEQDIRDQAPALGATPKS